MSTNASRTDVIVVGAGQAGLATSFHLKRLKVPHVVLESRASIGDQWRERWDSLQLFTPARYSHLPDLGLPMAGGEFPTKDQIADYFDSYAHTFDLPVRTGMRVSGLSRDGTGFRLDTSQGGLEAGRVVVATGPNTVPKIPDFAASLDPGITQLHTSQYRNPQQLPSGPVLVVGAGTSGAEIALELAQAGFPTSLAGRPTPHVPDAVFRHAGPLYWAFVNHVLTLDTPPGRKVAEKFPTRGAPLIRISMEKVEQAGVTRLPRVSGVQDGIPTFGAESAERPTTVIWATGFRPDLTWLPDVPTTPFGEPVTRRGVVESVPGLAFVGMPFQYALTSALIGGVGRDADFVAEWAATPAAVH